MARKRRVSKERRIASFILEALLVVSGVLALYHGLSYSTSNVTPRTVSEFMTINFGSDYENLTTQYGGQVTDVRVETPPVHIQIETTFEAQGGFGADNPIHVSAIITNVRWLQSNYTGPLTKYYCCVKYSGAVKTNDTSDSGSGFLTLTNFGNGTYSTSGELEWTDGGPTYSWLLPNWPPYNDYFYIAPSIYTNNGTRTTPTLAIDSISSTQAWESAQSTLQVEWVGVGVVILGASVEFARRVLNQEESSKK